MNVVLMHTFSEIVISIRYVIEQSQIPNLLNLVSQYYFYESRQMH